MIRTSREGSIMTTTGGTIGGLVLLAALTGVSRVPVDEAPDRGAPPAEARAATPAAPLASPNGLEGVPRLGHVFLIIGENTTYDHLDATNAPYLMGTIRP